MGDGLLGVGLSVEKCLLLGLAVATHVKKWVLRYITVLKILKFGTFEICLAILKLLNYNSGVSFNYKNIIVNKTLLCENGPPKINEHQRG